VTTARPQLVLAAVVVAVVFLAGCGAQGSPPRVPFLPKRVSVTAPVRVLFHSPAAPGAPGFHRYEYVFPDRQIDIYEARPPFHLVERISVPESHSVRGVAVSPRTHTLYVSLGGNGGSSGNGGLLAYDLLRNRVLWQRAFPTGTDSLAVTPDGRTLYVPEGERTMDDIWYVVNAGTGEVTHEIHAAPGPHNTIVATNGKLVYLGPRNSRYLVVASTKSNRVVKRIGPLKGGVRPFTIDPRRAVAYTTATGFLGFQVSSLRSGRLLYTVPIHGFKPGRSLGTPSHGISLTPDGAHLAVIDVPNGYVHVFDVSRVPRDPPRLVADVRLEPSMKGKEVPCGGDCGHAGWLQHSLDGRYLWVADDGDVIETATNKVIGFVPALRNSRYLFELDWRGGVPLRTSTRSGVARY
jgi:hypothetical protein